MKILDVGDRVAQKGAPDTFGTVAFVERRELDVPYPRGTRPILRPAEWWAHVDLDRGYRAAILLDNLRRAGRWERAWFREVVLFRWLRRLFHDFRDRRRSLRSRGP